MEEYIKWLENKIEVCLEDKDLQREHWAFCQALKKYRELALSLGGVSKSLQSEGSPIVTCASCGKEVTIVRPGKHQCDNEKCISNVC